MRAGFLDNESLAAFLEQIGLEGVREDIPYADGKTKSLWDEALAAKKTADGAIEALRLHLAMNPPRPGFYCGCCDCWHDQ